MSEFKVEETGRSIINVHYVNDGCCTQIVGKLRFAAIVLQNVCLAWRKCEGES